MEFLKGTSRETIESQTQPDHLYQNLADGAEVDSKRDAIAVFDVKPGLASASGATQSVLTTAPDDDMTPVDMSHKPSNSPRKIMGCRKEVQRE